MKDLLIALCIGIIAVLLVYERGHWMSAKLELVVVPPPKAPTPSPQKGESLRPDPPPPVASSSPEKAALATLVIQSQRAALTKYPSLGVPDSEINIRFTYRYKNLVADHSPRLQDPDWPVQLADECARDSGLLLAVKPSPPPPAVSSEKTAAIPLKVVAPAGTPAPSLRIQQPAAVPQTLVFHPAAGTTPQFPAAPTPVAAPKPSGVLPFVTLDAVNQTSGNNYT